jgi:hypothetical protein
MYFGEIEEFLKVFKMNSLSIFIFSFSFYEKNKSSNFQIFKNKIKKEHDLNKTKFN